MKHRASFLLGLVLVAIGFSLNSAAQPLKPVQLPPPQTTGGRPLMQVLGDLLGQVRDFLVRLAIHRLQHAPSIPGRVAAAAKRDLGLPVIAP